MHPSASCRKARHPACLPLGEAAAMGALADQALKNADNQQL